jgi:peptide deformylase
MQLTRRVLHKRARAVEFRYPFQNQQLAENMHGLMQQERGIGLAAPQIGISKRVFVMAIMGRQRSCFNPEITERSQDLVDWNEGCLSFPGDQCIIKRPAWIEVRYQDYHGIWQQERLEDLEARCFQHELDHLDGITMWDRHKEQNAKQS